MVEDFVIGADASVRYCGQGRVHCMEGVESGTEFASGI